MKDELKLKRDQQAGLKARQLLEDPMINDALNAIRKNLYDKIARSDFDQSEAREDAYRMLRSVEAFEGQFKRFINTGKIAEEKLGLLGNIVKRIQEIN